MLTKIVINNQAYEVDLLQDNEVIEQIKNDFIGLENISELTKQGNLEKVMSQYIDNYEKVMYDNKEYFIFKSRIPIEFKQKSYTKKVIPSDEMTGRVFGSFALPIMFIVTNMFDAACNFKNMINSKFGVTKINASFKNSEIAILSVLVVILNILFWGFYFDAVNNRHLPIWSIFVIQAINLALGVLKPINYHYNCIENYKLAPYTFDTKYSNLSESPIERLRAMKITPDKKMIDFDFSEETKNKEKESNHATY